MRIPGKPSEKVLQSLGSGEKRDGLVIPERRTAELVKPQQGADQRCGADQRERSGSAIGRRRVDVVDIVQDNERTQAGVIRRQDTGWVIPRRAGRFLLLGALARCGRKAPPSEATDRRLPPSCGLPWESALVEQTGDLESCRAWLRPEHLTTEAIHAYRERFAQHPACLLRISQVLLPDVAARLAAFLRQEAEFERIYGIVGGADTAPREEWLAAEESKRLFTFERLVRPRPEFKLSGNLFTHMRLRSELAAGSLRDYLRAVTGLPLGRLTAFNGQSLGVGDYLRRHRDTRDRRRLAFIFYLNPDWRAEYRGELRVVDRDEGEHLLPAEFNSLVCFDVDAHRYHEILPINPAAGDQRRLTLGGWHLDAKREHNPWDDPSRG